MKFTVNIKLNGKPFALVFENYNQETKRRYTIVKDPVIQEQLEKSPDFGIYFVKDEDFHDPNPEPKEAEVLVPETPAPPVDETGTPETPEPPAEETGIPEVPETPVDETDLGNTEPPVEGPVAVATEVPAVPQKETIEVENLADAKVFLTQRGVKTYPAMNKVKAIFEAEKLGIVLTIKN